MSWGNINKTFRKESEIIDFFNKNIQDFTNDDLSLIYRPFKNLKPKDVNLVILGGEPYQTPIGNGLPWGVKEGQNLPTPLVNIIKSIESDHNTSLKRDVATLEGWEKQGALLLPTSLTSKKGWRGSYNEFWHPFIQAALKKVYEANSKMIICALGDIAKIHVDEFINKDRFGAGANTKVIYAEEPSYNSFVRYGVFYQLNQELALDGKKIDFKRINL